MKHEFLVFLLSIVSMQLFGQVEMLNQQTFTSSVPAGNYSGIVNIKDDLYAVVSDKCPTDGFFIFKIDIDSITGKIRSVKNEGFRSSGFLNMDEEGITYRNADSTIYICSESNNKILQYNLDGRYTGKEISVPKNLKEKCSAKYGLESLSYNKNTHEFWTANENGEILIVGFDDNLGVIDEYHYKMDNPMCADRPASNYAYGVSELLAMNDSSLLVLEREFYVPKNKLGAFVMCKLYRVNPTKRIAKTDNLDKILICKWKKSLSLFNYSIANYEGMCLGPCLKDGRRTIILISDSQNQYAGILKDWFKVIIL